MYVLCFYSLSSSSHKHCSFTLFYSCSFYRKINGWIMSKNDTSNRVASSDSLTFSVTCLSFVVAANYCVWGMHDIGHRMCF